MEKPTTNLLKENPSKLDSNLPRTWKKTFDETFYTIYDIMPSKKNNQKAPLESMIIPDVTPLYTDRLDMS